MRSFLTVLALGLSLAAGSYIIAANLPEVLARLFLAVVIFGPTLRAANNIIARLGSRSRSVSRAIYPADEPQTVAEAVASIREQSRLSMDYANNSRDLSGEVTK